MNTPAVGAPAYSSYAAPMQQSAPAQQTYSTTGQSALAQTDNYQFRQHAQPQQFAAQDDNYSVINKTDLMLGAAGAVGGFFAAGLIGLSGPIGALILGVALLGISAGVRAIKHKSNKKQQQQAMQQQMQPVQFNRPQQMYQYPGQQQSQHYIPQQQAPQYQYPQQQQHVPQYQPAQYAPQPGQRPHPGQQPHPGQMPPGYQPGQPQQQQSMWDKILSWL